MNYKVIIFHKQYFDAASLLMKNLMKLLCIIEGCFPNFICFRTVKNNIDVLAWLSNVPESNVRTEGYV